MNSHDPLVSVIIPFFNRIDLTIRAVESVFNQTVQDFEIILVDDGSTESTQCINDMVGPKVRVLTQKNQGPAAARNLAMKNARGKYVAFLDSDDMFVANKLEYQLNIHEANPDIWLTHTSYQLQNEKSELLEIIHSGNFSGSVYPQIYYGCPIATSTVMLSRAVIDNQIWFEENIRISEDIIFFSKIARHSNIIGVDIPFTLFYVTEKTHGFNPKAQIKGSTNIANYIHDRKPDLGSAQKALVFCKLNEYIAYNYQLLNQPDKVRWYKLKAFYYSNNKQVRARNYFRGILAKIKININEFFHFLSGLIKKVIKFILRITHSLFVFNLPIIKKILHFISHTYQVFQQSIAKFIKMTLAIVWKVFKRLKVLTAEHAPFIIALITKLRNWIKKSFPNFWLLLRKLKVFVESRINH